MLKQHEVPKKSRLYRHATKGNDQHKEMGTMNVTPTMFKMDSGLRIVAFNYFNVVDEQILSVYFYDVDGQREIGRALGAQGFVCHQAAASSSDESEVVFMRDPIFGSEPVDKAHEINRRKDKCFEQS